MTEDEIIDGIIEREARVYTDRPHDRGGPTKFGITLTTLGEYRKAKVTPADVENMPIEEARAIYRHEFIEAPGFDTIQNDRLRVFVIDCGVNHGPLRAVILLQKALGVPPDGRFGVVTRSALAHADPPALYVRVCAERARFYGRIITNDHAQAENAAGWMNRLADLMETA